VGKGRTHRLGGFGLLAFVIVQDAQEENPGQLGHVLQRPGAVGAAQDVADAPHVGIERGLGGE